jgi:hypothetical protein
MVCVFFSVALAMTTKMSAALEWADMIDETDDNDVDIQINIKRIKTFESTTLHMKTTTSINSIKT